MERRKRRTHRILLQYVDVSTRTRDDAFGRQVPAKQIHTGKYGSKAMRRFLRRPVILPVLLPLACVRSRALRFRPLFALVLLSLYYAVVAAIFGYLEGWDALSSCYFATVVMSTVGYGVPTITRTPTTSMFAPRNKSLRSGHSPACRARRRSQAEQHPDASAHRPYRPPRLPRGVQRNSRYRTT